MPPLKLVFAHYMLCFTGWTRLPPAPRAAWVGTTLEEIEVACRNEVKPLLNGKMLSTAAQTAVNEFLTESGPGVLAIMACIQTVQAGNLSKKAMLAKVVGRG